MKKIRLTQNKFALVDDEDFDILSVHKWHCCKNGNTYYAKISRNNRKISMHTMIMNPPDNMVVDHINGDGLDNRKSNLRICTKGENHVNKKIPASNISGFKGVSYTENNNWRARIIVKGKSINLGRFNDRIKAAKAYNEAALKYHGEFARLNNI